jgi:hypothetical protein
MKRAIKQRSFDAILHGIKQNMWLAVDNVTHTIYPGTTAATRAQCIRLMLEKGISATHFAAEV